eukprot:scaffold57560_cov45-Prasinocladus_malaysianus.AAC.1
MPRACTVAAVRRPASVRRDYYMFALLQQLCKLLFSIYLRRSSTPNGQSRPPIIVTECRGRQHISRPRHFYAWYMQSSGA